MGNIGLRPTLIVFISNTCIMIIELVAGRILAPLLGVSLYTWTSIIGVVLAGISLGNYIGGRLADRVASSLLLARIFFACSLASLSILATSLFAGYLPFIGSAPIYVLMVTAFIFFLPGVLLGMVSPIVLKLTLQNLEESGRTVGSIYAASALGNIVGTFLTGFILISLMGTRLILLLVAVLLLITGIAVLDWRNLTQRDRRGSGLVVAVLILAIVLAWASGYSDSRCLQETNYFCIRILEESRGDETVELLVLDRMLHSMVDPANPGSLEASYDSEKTFAALIELLYPPDTQPALDTLTIGGGGYSFPQYLQVRYEEGRIDVIEIDPAVTQLAEERFGVSQETRIHSINDDARSAIRRLPPQPTYDVIMADVFNDFAVPYHLTTREFNDQLAVLMKEDSVYLVHVLDGPEGLFLRAVITTLRVTFPHVYVVPTMREWQRNERTSYILVASNQPIPPPDKPIPGLPESAFFLSEEEVNEFLAGGPAILLSDDFVPTDNLLAPVFASAFR